MTDVHPGGTYVDDEIDLRELFLVLWDGKVLITDHRAGSHRLSCCGVITT